MFKSFLLTLWCWKYVLNEMHAKPMWLKICFIFVIEPPAKRTDMHRRKFPAGSLVPGIFGWLCHVYTEQHPGFVQTVVMTALVPTWCASTSGGFFPLQKWQDWNNNISWDRNTMNLGSFLRWPSIGDFSLKTKPVRHWYGSITFLNNLKHNKILLAQRMFLYVY